MKIERGYLFLRRDWVRGNLWGGEAVRRGISWRDGSMINEGYIVC